MKLISYDTWKKHNTGNLAADGYWICGSDSGYGLFKSVYPKDIARVIIHETFNEEMEKYYEFVYWPHHYKGVRTQEDYIDIWCRKIK